MAEPARDKQDPGLAREQPGLGRLGQRFPRQVVRLHAPPLERVDRDRGQVERRLGEAALPQVVERPDDARSADVEVLHGQRGLPAVPLVRRPERTGVERGVDVGDDGRDPVAARASSHGSSLSGSNATGS